MKKLHILWTTDNCDTVFNMLFMYATNAKLKGWWEEVNIIIWGASAKLVGNDSRIQTEILEMIHLGITFEACRDCAENFGVTEILERLGINVRYMGIPFTEYLKSNEQVVTI
jgi:hypothetical protein